MLDMHDNQVVCQGLKRCRSGVKRHQFQPLAPKLTTFECDKEIGIIINDFSQIQLFSQSWPIILRLQKLGNT